MTAILANTMGAEMGLMPGLGFLAPWIGLPLSVMAAIVERPFYSAGGHRTDTIWYSLQANLISLCAGFPLALLFMSVGQLFTRDHDVPTFVAWPIASVPCSIVIERMYLARRAPGLSWGWAAAGNILSAAMCIGIGYSAFWLRRNFPQAAAAVRPYSDALATLALLGSIAVFMVSLVLPSLRRRRAVHEKGPEATPDNIGA